MGSLSLRGKSHTRTILKTLTRHGAASLYDNIISLLCHSDMAPILLHCVSQVVLLVGWFVGWFADWLLACFLAFLLTRLIG